MEPALFMCGLVFLVLWVMFKALSASDAADDKGARLAGFVDARTRKGYEKRVEEQIQRFEGACRYTAEHDPVFAELYYSGSYIEFAHDACGHVVHNPQRRQMP